LKTGEYCTADSPSNTTYLFALLTVFRKATPDCK